MTEPLLAIRSDRSRHRLTRRRVFMLCGKVPLAFTMTLLFHPNAGPWAVCNDFWCAGVLSETQPGDFFRDLALLFTALGNGPEKSAGVTFSGPLGALVLMLSVWTFSRMRKLND